LKKNKYINKGHSLSMTLKARSTWTVHTSAKARLTIVADPDLYPDPWYGLPPKFNHCSLPTFPENFMQIRSEVFAESC